MNIDSIPIFCLIFFPLCLIVLFTYILAERIGFNRGLKAAGVNPKDFWKELNKDVYYNIYKRGD